MNVQWNYQQSIERVSQGRPLASPGMSHEGQTGRISVVPALGRGCQTRLFLAAGAQPNSTAPVLSRSIKSWQPAISQPLSAPQYQVRRQTRRLSYQAAPPTFRIGARRSRRKQFSYRETELDGTWHLKARPRSVWRAQTSGRPHGQEELPLLNDSGETT